VAVQGTLLELGVEAFYGVESRARSAGQRAEFWVIGGRLSPCLRTDVTDRFSLKGCGALEFSGVHAEGVNGAGVERVKEDLVPFWALGLATGLGVVLTPSLSLAAELGAQFPLARRRFYFSNPNTNLHEFPAVAARGSLGVCYAF
jgi:hypothetical protein